MAKVTRELIAELVRLRDEEQMSWPQMAKQTGLTLTIVRNEYRKAKGLARPKEKKRSELEHKLTIMKKMLRGTDPGKDTTEMEWYRAAAQENRPAFLREYHRLLSEVEKRKAAKKESDTKTDVVEGDEGTARCVALCEEWMRKWQ